jgi:DNA-binding response OmpR family regulator
MEGHIGTLSGVTTILVVEDEPDIRELIRLNLEPEGFKVLLAADGEEGLAMAAVASPDAIILDVRRPARATWTA